MTAIEIKKGIYSVGAIDWDRKLFDELIPLPEGTSYNSYLVTGSEKTALIDTVDPSKIKDLLFNLNQVKVKKIDYIISNHAEQDHSGSLAKILQSYPMAKIVTNPKCKDFLQEHLLLSSENFIIVQDRETLDLGDRTLEFILTPWVHWPETMVTYLKEEKILFSCDFFGSHLATSKIFAETNDILYTGAKRYFAEIMMPFRSSIKGHLEKLRPFTIEMIAPSHGPIYTNPEFIINAYKDWISDNVKNEVVLPYVSMHGSTERMVHYFIDALVKRKIEVKSFNLPKTDIGELAISLVDTATVVIGSSTVLVGAHPLAAYATFLFNALRPKTKYVSIIASYGWGSKLIEQLSGMITNIKPEIIPPVLVKGFPKDQDFKALDQLADEILKKHQQINII